MDKNDVLKIKSLEKQNTDSRAVGCFIKDLEAYVETGEPAQTYYISEENYKDIVELLGIGTVCGKDIIESNVYNTVSERLVTLGSGIEGSEFDLGRLINVIADTQYTSEDYINDFTVTVAIKIDERTAVIVGNKSEEIEIECRYCPTYHWSYDETCDHDREFEYSREYWVAVLDADGLRDRPYWHKQDLEYHDIDAERALAESEEIKYEERAGIINLARLACGDQVIADLADGSNIRFKVMRPGDNPLGYIFERSKDGEDKAPRRVMLRGAGVTYPRPGEPGYGFRQKVVYGQPLRKEGRGQQIMISPPDKYLPRTVYRQENVKVDVIRNN